MDGSGYFVAPGLSLLLHKSGSTVPRQFIERDEIPAEFLQDPQQTDSKLGTGPWRSSGPPGSWIETFRRTTP